MVQLPSCPADYWCQDSPVSEGPGYKFRNFTIYQGNCSGCSLGQQITYDLDADGNVIFVDEYFFTNMDGWAGPYGRGVWGRQTIIDVDNNFTSTFEWYGRSAVNTPSRGSFPINSQYAGGNCSRTGYTSGWCQGVPANSGMLLNYDPPIWNDWEGPWLDDNERSKTRLTIPAN